MTVTTTVFFALHYISVISHTCGYIIQHNFYNFNFPLYIKWLVTDAYCEKAIPELTNGNYSINSTNSMYPTSDEGYHALYTIASYDCNYGYRLVQISALTPIVTAESTCEEFRKNPRLPVTYVHWTEHNAECIRKWSSTHAGPRLVNNSNNI